MLYVGLFCVCFPQRRSGPDLRKLANEKLPTCISNVQLLDLKQARAALAATRDLYDGAQQPAESDLAVFLTSLGASMFAQASSRVRSKNEVSLLDIRDHKPLLPVHKDVHRIKVNVGSSVNISVPSHVVAKHSPHSNEQRFLPRIHPAQLARNAEKKENAMKIRQEAIMCAKMRAVAKIRRPDSVDDHFNKGQLLQKRLQAKKRMESRVTAAKAKVRIVVVGAGLAGISAAEQLLYCGFTNVVVLEALDRIGGRIHTVHRGDSPFQNLELGAAHLDHANEANSLYCLVKACGLPEEEVPLDTEESAILFENELLPKNQDLLYTDNMCKLLVGDSRLIYTLIKSQQRENIRLAYKDYIRERYRRLGQRGDLAPGRLSSVCQMANNLHVSTKYTLGNGAGDLGLHLLGLHQNNGGTTVEVLTGMSSLLTPLTCLLNADRIKLRTRVKQVHWRAAHKWNELNCQITCADGITFSADHVIIAVPLGHLKETADAMFVPPLTKEKSVAIKRLGFGTVAKVHMCYEKEFWSKPFKFIWPGKEGEVNTILSQTLKMASKSPRTVEVVLLGDASELVADSEIAQQLTSLLCLYFKTVIPLPAEIRKSEWSSNVLFRGTHPYMSTHCSEDDVFVLGEPLMCGKVPVVQFAGDYTHNNYSCLTHAARFSGLREAYRLENLYNVMHGLGNMET